MNGLLNGSYMQYKVAFSLEDLRYLSIININL